MGSNDAYAGKLAFLTGASEGIGLSIAQQMARCGSHVVLISRNPGKLDKARAKLHSAKVDPAQRLGTRPADLTSWEQTACAIDALVEEYGTPDYLINCAGYARPGYIDDLSLEHFRGMMELNYMGLVHAVKSMLPHFIRKGGGTLVNTSSVAGFVGLFGYSGYCASKYAVIGFSEALRRELKVHGVRVSVLCPPNTRTPGLEEENKYKPPEVLATEEKIKVQDADEVARAFLKALPKDPFLITTTWDSRLTLWLSRWAPSLLDYFVKRPALRD